MARKILSKIGLKHTEHFSNVSCTYLTSVEFPKFSTSINYSINHLPSILVHNMAAHPDYKMVFLEEACHNDSR